MVATSRGYDAATQLFTTERSRHLNFQALTISIPPDHKAGAVEYSNFYARDPERNFVTIRNDVIDEAAFVRGVNENLPPSGEVMVFVHGYNTTHQEAVLRLTQLAHDANLKPEPILFSWPSLGRLTMYLADRESSTAARNRLHDLLVILQNDPKVSKINILAHSMGTMLTIDTLMMAKLRGNPEYGGKLDNIVLAAPDIDMDVFLSQFEIIGRRGRPTAILFSTQDGALAASRFLAGDVPRVGDFVPDTPQAIQAVHNLGLSVIDISDLAQAGSLNHSNFATNTAALEQIGSNIGGATMHSSSHDVGVFVLGVTGNIARVPSIGIPALGGLF